ncbi:putative glycolipid-binding domain-containing protein [Promicromonospora sp. NPDC057488]|uniref:putative glycolipid-binding domain-containing protein n=1 Tax=Promicromonospora sp. NPDC057488 TaxID=3346147 RepID=UPI00366E3558
MRLRPVPPVSAWAHAGVRTGFEVMFAERTDRGHVLRGHTAAVEGEQAWSVGYLIEVDRHWRTRRAEIVAVTAAGALRTVLERADLDADTDAPAGTAQLHDPVPSLDTNPAPARWLVDGAPDPRLDGCLDVDLESSAVTNTLPVHRLDLSPGRTHRSPAAFVRAQDLGVQRIEQDYRFRERTPGTLLLDYASATFDFACVLTLDAAGLVLEYPGIAVRER